MPCCEMDAADQEGDQHDDRHGAPAHLLQMMHHRGQAKAARMDQHANSAGGQHRTQHADQLDKSAADPGNGTADLVEHAGDGHRGAFDDRRGFHAADLVDQRGIVRREACDLRFDAALCSGCGAARSISHAPKVSSRETCDISMKIFGRAAGELLRLGHHRLQCGGKARNPRPCGMDRARARCRAQSAPKSGRRSRPQPRR